ANSIAVSSPMPLELPVITAIFESLMVLRQILDIANEGRIGAIRARRFAEHGWNTRRLQV
ncbi:MAG TPA: hypothetical protein VE779_11260, partial [Candidatus Angelobacter sp.]|nr:hypothetical protein [Candidatus Angelobacter sp.]